MRHVGPDRCHALCPNGYGGQRYCGKWKQAGEHCLYHATVEELLAYEEAELKERQSNQEGCERD